MENKCIQLAKYYVDMFSIVSEYYSVSQNKALGHFYKKYDVIISWANTSFHILENLKDTFLYCEVLNENTMITLIPVRKEYSLIGYQVFIGKLDAEEYYMDHHVLKDKLKKVTQMFYYSLYEKEPSEQLISNTLLGLKYTSQQPFERVNQHTFEHPITISQSDVDYLEFSILQSFKFYNYDIGIKSVTEYINLTKQLNLQQKKNQLMSLLIYLTKTVIELGYPTRSAYGIRDSYLEKLNFIQNYDDVLLYGKKMYQRFYQKIKDSHLGSSHFLINETLKFIENHLYSSFKIKDIAKQLGCTPNYLSNLFKKYTNINLNYFITQRKIEEAKYLIKYEHLRLSEISEILGFSSQSLFTSNFKKITNQTPKEFSNLNNGWTM